MKADKRSGLNCVVALMADMKCDKKVRFTVQIGVVYWSQQVNLTTCESNNWCCVLVTPG